MPDKINFFCVLRKADITRIGKTGVWLTYIISYLATYILKLMQQ